MRFLEIETVEPFSTDKQQHGKNQGDSQPDPLANGSVFPRFFLFSGPEGFSSQRHSRYLHSVREGKPQGQDIHTDIVRRELIRSQPGCYQRRRQKTDARGDVLQ